MSDFNDMSSVLKAGQDAANQLAAFSAQIAQDKRQEKQIEAQKEMQREQNEYNYQRWLENNEYNSPLMQRQLFEQAGLNPAMFIQGLDAKSGSPVTASTVSVPSYAPAPPFNDMASNASYLNAITQQEQLKLASKKLDLESRKTDAEIDKLKSDTDTVLINNKYLRFFNEKNLQKLDQEISNLCTQQLSFFEDIYFKAKQAQLTEENITTERVMRDINAKKIIADTLLSKAKIRLSDKQLDLLSEQITSFVLSNGEKAANIDLDGNQIRILKNSADSSDIQLDVLKINKKMLDESYDTWDNKFGRKHPLLREILVNLINSVAQVGSAVATMKFTKLPNAQTPNIPNSPFSYSSSTSF
jgi:hypothetical protein